MYIGNLYTFNNRSVIIKVKIFFISKRIGLNIEEREREGATEKKVQNRENFSGRGNKHVSIGV